MIPFDRWFTSAEHLAGDELDPTAAHEWWEKGKHPDEFVSSLTPPCVKCQIPGGPAHEPSPKCHYRPHVVTHCSCRACF